MKRILTGLTVAAVLVGVPGLVSAQATQTGPATQAAPTAPTRPRAGPPVRASWTSDRIALKVGDIVTILVDEQTEASADRNESATRQHDRNLGLNGGTGLKTSGGTLRTQNDVQDGKKGGSSRSQQFTAQLSTRVVEVGPNGLLRLDGKKKVKIDKHEEEVEVRGWVRPDDVGMDNTVYSWRVADAEILYTSNGALVKAGGLWSKLLDLIIP